MMTLKEMREKGWDLLPYKKLPYPHAEAKKYKELITKNICENVMKDRIRRARTLSKAREMVIV